MLGVLDTSSLLHGLEKEFGSITVMIINCSEEDHVPSTMVSASPYT